MRNFLITLAVLSLVSVNVYALKCQENGFVGCFFADCQWDSTANICADATVLEATTSECSSIRVNSDCNSLSTCYWTSTGMMGACLDKTCDQSIERQDCETKSACTWSTTGMRGACLYRDCSSFVDFQNCKSSLRCVWNGSSCSPFGQQ